ncbi:purine catabolism regulatory protein [Xylanibacillus composti]|uniref:Purine catabolism regulatory protein n=1 Tax=Xylanibacillus composti TaxID=1572762 RepID=A0A8J4M3N2_9BACL|nr:PucR family transcriptional regulator [Xylanibacillus composti]GIQ69681.1 purine catabolism regulatory protein [Xylanibacillus composti]
MQLADLLHKLSFPPSTVLAGKSGLHRSIQSVNIMDTPDMIRYLKKDELLLTNAYVMKDDPEQLIMLVNDMQERGCAGLMISSRRFLPEHPQQLLTVAERLNFPIIEPPPGLTLGEISNKAIGFILEQKTDEMKYALDCHQHFSSMVIQGQGLPEIINALAAVLEHSIALFDHHFDSLALSNNIDYASFAPVLANVQQILRELPLTSPATRLCLLHDRADWRRTLTVYAIHSYQPSGFLVVFGETDDGRNLSHLAIEQAINVIQFEILKRQAVKERSRRYKNEFFADVVEGYIASEQNIMHRGSRYGLVNDSKYQTIVAKIDSFGTSNPYALTISEQETKERIIDQLYEYVKPALLDKGQDCIRFVKNDAVVLLLPTSNKGPWLEELLSDVSERAFHQQQLPISFGVGKPVDHLLDLPLSYKEALEALEFGYRCGKERFVQLNNNRELVDLFRFMDINYLKAFYKHTVQPFAHLEEKERTDLLLTLKVYYDQNCRIAETASRLFVHRNTVIYRLDKCAQILERELTAADESLRFRIAFLIEPLLQQPS